MSDQTPVAAPAPATPPPSKLRDPNAYVVTDMRDEIAWMSDDAQLAAWAKGERRERSERKWKTAKPGETVKGLPATSTPWMLADGWIVKPGQPWRINPDKSYPDDVTESEAEA